MPDSPEAPRRNPKMAQGRKAGERPPDDLQDLTRNHLRKIKTLQEKKILEILNQKRRKD